MEEPEVMDAAKLAALVRSQIFDAVGYDQTELSLRRVKAIEYYRGELRDLESRDGWSKITTRDLSDHIGWILPSLMRVFAASDNIVCYEPEGPEDEQNAKQASDYVNYVFWRECQGYRVLWDSIQDALMFGNGIIKFWWEDAEKIEFEDFTGLSDDAFTQLVSDDSVEVLEHSEEIKTELIPDPTGQQVEQPYTCHDVKIKRTTKQSCLRIASLPPEEFLIERGATSLEAAKFACHRTQRTRQSLIDEGYDKDLVMAIGSDYDMQAQPERVARWNRILYDQNHYYSDPLMVEVEVFEAYVRIDFDGDGYAEWRKVVLGGLSGANVDPGKSEHSVLANEPWSDEVPFAEIIPNPDAHIWKGRSALDELEDVQKIKTVLTRQTLDNLYLANIPQRVAVLKDIENPDEVMNPTVGGVIISKSNPDAVREVVTPFVAQHSYTMLEYQDMVAEKRTGVSRQSMALDPEALSDQTATGQMLAQSASYSKIELAARNVAEIGLKRLFRCILKLLVRYQDRPKMIRLRNQWIPMDPRSWNANMDATVSVGLGSGSRDRDTMLLMQIATKQEMIMAQLGPTNPITNMSQYANTLRKMVESSGLREPDQFFSEVNPQALQQFMQQQSQKQQDPKVMQIQMQAQLDERADQRKAQIEQVQAQADIATNQQKLQAEMGRDERDYQLKKELALFQAQLDQARFDREEARKDREHQQKMSLAHEQHVSAMQQAAMAAKQADTKRRETSE